MTKRRTYRYHNLTWNGAGPLAPYPDMRCERFQLRAVSRRYKTLDLEARFVAAFFKANFWLAPLDTYLSILERPPPGGSPDLKNQSCTGCGQRPRQNHLTSADKSISIPDRLFHFLLSNRSPFSERTVKHIRSTRHSI